MKRNRKNNIGKERIIMIASSAFVLAALTMTGIYIKDKENQVKDDGYSIDFDQLENNVDQKYQEITQNTQEKEPVAEAPDDTILNNPVLENDLDYLPMEEAGSNLIEIPGLTDKESLDEDTAGQMGGSAPDADGGEAVENEEAGNAVDKDAAKKDAPDTETDKQTAADQVTVEKTLHYSEEQGLARPAAGEVLMHYSMDSSIYFSTLDQYKYNPAVILKAAEGDVVSACADGKVVSVFTDEEIGNAVTLDLGDGYQATYGQLKDIAFQVGSYVNKGEQLGLVAQPTKYYSVEGTNLYFSLTKDGNPVNPENLF